MSWPAAARRRSSRHPDERSREGRAQAVVRVPPGRPGFGPRRAPRGVRRRRPAAPRITSYNVCYTKLLRLERPYRLRIGQRLKLRAEPSAHQVRPGENIAKIAKRYGTSTRALIRANDLKAPYRLKVGQKLSIPSAGTRPSRAAARRKPALDRARPPVRRSNSYNFV